MNVDMTALRALVREKDISFDLVVEALEAAMLTAYHRTEGAQEHARVVLDRRTGEVTVFAQEVGPEGNVLREYEDTPAGFGRIAERRHVHDQRPQRIAAPSGVEARHHQGVETQRVAEGKGRRPQLLPRGGRQQCPQAPQDAFVRALERLDSFDGRARFSTWLHAIALNLWRDSRRRQARQIEAGR